MFLGGTKKSDGGGGPEIFPVCPLQGISNGKSLIQYQPIRMLKISCAWTCLKKNQCLLCISSFVKILVPDVASFQNDIRF